MAEPSKPKEPVLLSGGNPQIPKGDGRGPVEAYIAAMPGWKRDVGEWIDAIVMRTVPDVRMAVRWNSPFYGMPDDGWFLSFHCLTRYVKAAFLTGGSLVPPPPVASKQPGVRYFHVHEGDAPDEERFASWVEQAAGIPGDRVF